MAEPTRKPWCPSASHMVIYDAEDNLLLCISKDNLRSRVAVAEAIEAVNSYDRLRAIEKLAEELVKQVKHVHHDPYAEKQCACHICVSADELQAKIREEK